MILCISNPYPFGERLTENPMELIKTSGFVESIGAEWVEIQPNFAAYDRPIDAVNAALAETMQAHPNHFPLIFAASCMGSIGAVKGMGKPNAGIVWFDAHGDFNTPATTPSGFIGGMPLAMLVGRGDTSYLENIGLAPLEESGVILTDARNLDPAEADAVKNSQITHLTRVEDVLKTPLPDKPLYIHVDADVLDASIFPATGYAEPNGASIEDMVQALTYLAASGKIAAATVTVWEMNRTDNQQAQLDVVLQLARAVMGKTQ